VLYICWGGGGGVVFPMCFFPNVAYISGLSILDCPFVLFLPFIKVDLFGYVRLKFMVFIATFNNISVLSWRSVLVMEETGVPG
jgi:hypothetical protein